MRLTYRLFNIRFWQSACGFGPQVTLFEKIWRAIRIIYWYVPGRSRLQKLVDRFDRASPYISAQYTSATPELTTMNENIVVAEKARGIELSCILSMPEKADGPLPVILYSVPVEWGLKLRPANGRILREYLAGRQFAVLWVWHKSADRILSPIDVEEQPDPLHYIERQCRDEKVMRHRMLDITFLVDTLEKWNAPGGRLAGKLDLEHIGLCGNSTGARTAMSLAGAPFESSRTSYKDSRIRCVVSLSLSPVDDPCREPGEFSAVTIPVLHIGGTRDTTLATPTLPEDAVRGFELIEAPGQYRLMLKRGDHVTFSGGREEAGVANGRELRNQQWLRWVSLAFFEAYLKEESRARQWLDSECAIALGRDGNFDVK